MIGIFDSGYGGLTILNHIRQRLPEYDYLYLGDNARAPYGTRSFDVIYEYTLEAVNYLQKRGCQLIILACNTASAKALRSIQQNDINPDEIRVLGVIRPTVEVVPTRTRTKHIGILATQGTVASESYVIELQKQDPELVITQQACPMWVPLVENEEYNTPGADYFVRKHIDNLLQQDPQIDSVILGCTHYPLLRDKIRQWMPDNIHIIEQGNYVAQSLKDYLSRHQNMSEHITTDGTIRYLTTEQADVFQAKATIFMDTTVEAERVFLE